MLFNINKIAQLKDYINKQVQKWIVENIGNKGLPYQKGEIKAKTNILEDAFKIGMFTVNSDKKDLSFHELQKIIRSNKFLPLSQREQDALNSIVIDATRDINNFGEKLGNQLQIIISEKDKQKKLLLEKIIGDKTKEAILKRQSVKELASELFHATPDWARNWVRVANYNLHSCFNQARAKEIERIYGIDSEVYFYVYPQACKTCVKLYLTNGIGSKPKIFKLSEIIENGSNIGRKQKDWKQTINSTHPFCRCEIIGLGKDKIWNEDKKKFESKPYDIEKETKEMLRLYELWRERKKQRAGGQEIKKGFEDEMKEQIIKTSSSESIISQYKAVNEYEHIFRESFALLIGEMLENTVKIINQ